MADKHTPKMYLRHRERLRASAEEDITALDNYKLLELYLFDLLPRVDTYPASHRLLDKFGSVDGVFSATREELESVFGIGKKSAERIMRTGEIINRAVLENLTAGAIDTDEAAIPVVSWLLRNREVDTSLVLVLNENSAFVEYKIFHPDDAPELLEKYVKKCAKREKSKFILAHVHPERYLKPTPEDISSTKRIEDAARKYGGVLTEHYICTHGGAVGIMKSGDLRNEG